MYEKILLLAGKPVTVFVEKSDTIKCKVWGTLSYSGNSLWKISRAYSWDSSIQFHEADVVKVTDKEIYLR